MTRRRYRCPGCSAVLVYDHHPSIEADPLPLDLPCPGCGFVQEAYEQALAMPAIRTTIVAAVDGLHRAMEEGSEHRALVAQEQFGLDASEAAGLRETDSRTGIRQGDTSFVPVNNPVSQAIATQPQSFGFAGTAAQQGMAASPMVQSGAFPNAGLRAMEEVRAGHARLVASTGHKTAATSSVPALETQQPGYRKRI